MFVVPFLSIVMQALLVIVVASFVVDCLHWTLHRCMASPSPFWRAIGGAHAVHHAFLNPALQLDTSLVAANMRWHQIPEFLTQLGASALFYLVLPPLAVALAQAVFIGLFIPVARVRGQDAFHEPANARTSPQSGLTVDAPYHLRHHLYPNRYFSSYFPLFDRLFGTGCQIAGRRFLVTGASGAFGAPLCDLIEAGGGLVTRVHFGQDWTYDDLSRLDPHLRIADVLVLSHGSKLEHAMEANCTSFVALIERFRALTAGRPVPGEVWAVGSEIEAHPAFGIAALQVYLRSKRAYARHAWRYYRDPHLLYRHIVPAGFTSRMGPGLISGRTAARIAYGLMRRGFRYVPVTYTGIAFWNFVKFLIPRPTPLSTGSVR